MNKENYQKNVTDNLKIHKICDNASGTDAMKMLIIKCNNEFDCISTLTDIITKPNYKITNDNIIAIIPIVRDCELFRFNKIQFVEDNVVIYNLFINKIQLVVGGQVIIDDLEIFNMYFPIIACPYQPCEFRVFINKTSITHQVFNNIMLTFEKVWLNNTLRSSLIKQNYELFKDIKRENGLIVKKYEDKYEEDVSYLINQEICQSTFSFNKYADAIYNIEILTVDINMNKISNQISKVSIEIGGNEVYNKINTDNYYLEEFNAINPIPLKYLIYHGVQLNITTDEPNQLILIKYKQKDIKDIKTPFYISKNILIDGGLGVLTNPSKLENIPHISEYI